MTLSDHPNPPPRGPLPPGPLPSGPLPSGPLLQAARRFMRPVVRLMIRNGLTFPVLAETLRCLFVDVASNDILSDPKSRTDSRISLLTGVHRKEIKRLREAALDAAEIPEVITLVSQIVGRWIGTAAFTGADGHPRPLLRVGHDTAKDQASFEALVESVTTDIRPRAVLDDLLGHGVVYMDSDDRVRLRAEAFIPRPGGEEQLFYFARNLHDHVASAVANISATEAPPFLDRSVHYDGLTLAQAKALEDYARAAAMHALLDVNRHALELLEAPSGAGDADHHRVNFGVYVFDDKQPSSGGDAP